MKYPMLKSACVGPLGLDPHDIAHVQTHAHENREDYTPVVVWPITVGVHCYTCANVCAEGLHKYTVVWACNYKFLEKSQSHVTGNKLIFAWAPLVLHGSCGTFFPTKPLDLQPLVRTTVEQPPSGTQA